MKLLSVTLSEGDDRLVVSASGELDISTSAVLERELARAEASQPSVLVLDLSDLTFMDSTGLRLVLSADARAREQGRRLAVVPGPSHVRRVFDISGVTSRIELLEEPIGDGTAE